MEQRELVVVLADISGYTRFMLANQTSAMHGQLVITGLIQSLLKQVDIPLTLQEIEGDAVFLYAAHPGTDAGWRDVLAQVSVKLDRFFDAFIRQWAIAIESTPCPCEICTHADQLGLKIIVHVGTAVFHEIAGRPQVSGPDVILAHRLLKNSIEQNEYLLVTDAAYTVMRDHLPGDFESSQESYDGFGIVPTRVRLLDAQLRAARDALFQMSESDTKGAVGSYARGMLLMPLAAALQLRHPVRKFTLRERLAMLVESLWEPLAFLVYYRREIPRRVLARGKPRPNSTV
jgi:hypothetical protein